MITKEFIASMEVIASALKEKGYDPYDQICGYLQKNDPAYITRYKGARELIQKLDKRQIESYLARMK